MKQNTGSAESQATRTVREALASGRPITYIRSSEEGRIARVLRDAGNGTPVWTWTLTEGLRLGDAAPQPDTRAPRAALDFIAGHSGAGIFHLRDFHEPLRESAEIRRRLRDLHESCLDRQKFVSASSEALRVAARTELTTLFERARPRT